MAAGAFVSTKHIKNKLKNATMLFVCGGRPCLFNQKHERVINAYKFDFIAFYRKDLDWIAFVTILLNVNIGLIMIDNYIIFVPENKNVDLKTAKFPLKHV